MTSSTRISGAEAPAVMPSAADGAEQGPVDVLGALDQAHERTAGALRDLAQALRIGGIGRAHDDHGIDLRRHALHRAPGGWSWRSRCLPCAGRRSRESAPSGPRRCRRVSSTESVVWVMKARLSGSRGSKPRASSDRLDQGDRALGQLAHGADDLGMAGMADEHDVAAALWWICASRCTLVTSGQVASRRRGCGPAAAAGTDFGDPVGGEDHRRVGLGISRAPRRRPRPSPSGPRPRIGCGRSRGGHRPARRGRERLLDDRWRGRRPAQKPRGAQSRMSRGGFVMIRRCGEKGPSCQAGATQFRGGDDPGFNPGNGCHSRPERSGGEGNP